MRRLIPFLYLPFFLIYNQLAAQNSGQCGLIRVGTAAGLPGDTVTLDLRAELPTGLGSFQFRVSWDTTALQLVDFDTTGTVLPDLTPTSFGTVYPGSILISWFTPTGFGLHLPPNALLYRFRARIRPEAPAFSPVIITNNYIMPFEVSDSSLTLLPDNRAFGGVWLGNPASGVPKVTQMCCTRTGCNASALGAIDLSVSGGVPPYQYAWSGPGLAEAATEDLNHLKVGEYTVVVTDQNGFSTTAVAQIEAAVNTLSISQPVITSASCVGGGSVSFQTSGGQAPYTYQWLPGGYTTPSLTDVNAGAYKVTVTDALSCTRIGTFGIGSPPQPSMSYALQRPGCGADSLSGKITVYGAGGTPPYNYTWNIPGESDNVAQNIAVGEYFVTMSDQGGCTSVKSFVLNSQGTQNWYVDGYGNCEPNGPGYSHLSIYGNGTLKWPLTIGWSNGVTHIVGGINNFVDDTIFGLTDGVYRAMLTDSLGCRMLSPQMQTQCEANYLYDGKTCLTFRIGQVSAQPGDTVYVPLTVQSLKSMNALQLQLAWDPARLQWLKYVSHAPVWVNNGGSSTQPGRGTIFVNEIFGFSMPDDAVFGEICFVVPANTPTGETPLFFYKSQNGGYGSATVTVDGNLKDIGFIGYNGSISIGAPAPVGLYLNSCATFSEDCAADRMAHLEVSVENGLPPFAVDLEEPSGQRLTDLNGLGQLNTGAHTLNISDASGRSASMIFQHNPPPTSNLCVWPGDADNNNAVNHFDLLYLGRAFGSTGKLRANNSLNWTGQQQLRWNQWTPLRHVDFANMDCNGDSLINAADTLAIIQNWGQVIRPGIDQPRQMPIFQQPNSSGFVVAYVQPDTTTADALALSVQIGTADHPVDSLQGLAFSVFYDPVVVEASSLRFEPGASWFGNPGDLLWVQKNFPAEGRLDVALTQKGISPHSGYGPVGLLHASVVPDVFLLPPGASGLSNISDTLVRTPLRIGEMLALNALEEPMANLGLDTLVVLINASTTSSTTMAGSDVAIRVFPNPAREIVQVSSTAAALQEIRLCNSQGILVRSFPASGKSLTRLDLGDCPAGLYLLEIHTDLGWTNSKLILQH